MEKEKQSTEIPSLFEAAIKSSKMKTILKAINPKYNINKLEKDIDDIFTQNAISKDSFMEGYALFNNILRDRPGINLNAQNYQPVADFLNTIYALTEKTKATESDEVSDANIQALSLKIGALSSIISKINDFNTLKSLFIQSVQQVKLPKNAAKEFFYEPNKEPIEEFSFFMHNDQTYIVKANPEKYCIDVERNIQTTVDDPETVDRFYIKDEKLYYTLSSENNLTEHQCQTTLDKIKKIKLANLNHKFEEKIHNTGYIVITKNNEIQPLNAILEKPIVIEEAKAPVKSNLDHIDLIESKIIYPDPLDEILSSPLIEKIAEATYKRHKQISNTGLNGDLNVFKKTLKKNVEIQKEKFINGFRLFEDILCAKDKAALKEKFTTTFENKENEDTLAVFFTSINDAMKETIEKDDRNKTKSTNYSYKPENATIQYYIDELRSATAKLINAERQQVAGLKEVRPKEPSKGAL